MPAEEAIRDGDSSVAVSAATAWELSVTAAKRVLRFPSDFHEQLEPHRFVPLPITPGHALAAGRLPARHRDPFDRIRVAQAQLENPTVVMRDHGFAAYAVAGLPA